MMVFSKEGACRCWRVVFVGKEGADIGGLYEDLECQAFFDFTFHFSFPCLSGDECVAT